MTAWLYSWLLRSYALVDNSLIVRIFRIRLKDVSLKTQKIKATYCRYIAVICCKVREYDTKYEQIHRVGLRRIERELDVAKLIRSMLTIKALLRAMTTK
jgi:hypothetical protein